MSFSFNRSTILYIILLISPFINIINHNISSKPIFIILGALFLISLIGLKRVNSYKEHYFFITLILYAFFIYILIVTSYRVRTTYIIFFFTAPAFFYLYYSSVFDLRHFIRKYYKKLLKYYIIIIFLSIALDSVILHVIEDVSLQLMYQAEAYSYHIRPHGITGNATVNSVLIVFFYSLLLSTKANNKGFYFGLISISVFLQGSGLGYLVYGALLFFIVRRKKNGNYIALVGVFLILLLYLFFPVNGKLSPLYFLSMYNVFLSQYSTFISSIGNVSDFLFGNVSGGIDYLPIFLTSNMGFLYLLLIICLFVYLISMTKSYYETVSLYLIIFGSLHYPVLFYMLTAFFFPVFIFKIINYKALDL
jgi:hypothetical protein